MAEQSVESEWLGAKRAGQTAQEMHRPFDQMRLETDERRAMGEARAAELALASRIEAELTRPPARFRRFADL